ncbi:MAG: N-acetylmuramoyl-L-alanine amidase [Pseudomonadota bacterium]
MCRSIIAMLLALCFGMTGAKAQDLRALARLDPSQSKAMESGSMVDLEIMLSQAVPWTVTFRSDPNEMIISFNELAPIEGWDLMITPIESPRFYPAEDGWSHLAFPLNEPLLLVEASMATQFGETSQALLRLSLAPTTPDIYRNEAEPRAQAVPAPEDYLPARMTVAIDPGHGGIDPGAEVGDLRESDLMLIYGRALKESLLRTGIVDVVLTRDEDIFVPLDARLRQARMANAALLISLHADALDEEDGKAGGATIYTLPSEGEKAANQIEVERHDRAQLMAGVDLSGTEDEVAMILMDLARNQTAPQSLRLADSVENAFQIDQVRLNSRPRREAPFAVLRAADIPAVLVEVGFLSSDFDRPRLTSDEGRKAVIDALSDAVLAWVADETARIALRRQ